MEEKIERHQVVIVGGGVTGLTLALCLERLQVDYVLLEAYGDLTPDAGASLVLFAHAQRVLAQLGLLDALRGAALPQAAIDYRDGATGRSLGRRSMWDALGRRHGYGNLWTSRHRVLRVLHAAVADKAPLRVHQRVARIADGPDEARVYTADGAVYAAQAVVGADGVHSVVRREMWRHADRAGPGTVPAADRGEVGCEYGCYYAAGRCGTPAVRAAFDACPGALVALPEGQIVVGRGRDDEFYLLCIWVRPAGARRCRLDDVPRPDAAETAGALARFRDVVVAGHGVRVRDLLDHQPGGVRGGATTLPHYALRRWGHGRLVALGDAVHRFNPVAGQGANSCIDDCAELINALQAHLGPRLAARPAWPLADLERAFRDLEAAAVGKATTAMQDGQDMIRLLSWRGWLDKLIYRYVVPYAPMWLLLWPHSAAVVSGTRLKGKFEAPEVKHEWPYKDEIQSEK